MFEWFFTYPVYMFSNFEKLRRGLGEVRRHEGGGPEAGRGGPAAPQVRAGASPGGGRHGGVFSHRWPYSWSAEAQG